MSIDCTTPGLFYDKPEDIYSFGDDESAPIPGDPDKAEKSAENFVKINQLLQKIHYYHKNPKCDDWKDWIDRTSNETIYQDMLELYLGCDYAFIEISL